MRRDLESLLVRSMSAPPPPLKAIRARAKRAQLRESMRRSMLAISLAAVALAFSGFHPATPAAHAITAAATPRPQPAPAPALL